MEARARRTIWLKEIGILGGNIFRDKGERLPGITRASESFPVEESFEDISGFSDVLDLVHRAPVAISELSDFLHLRLGSHRGADASDMNDGSGAKEEML